MDKKFIGSTLAIIFGIIAIVAGISSPSSTVFAGISMLLGGLAYRSAKKRNLGVSGSFGRTIESTLLIIMIAILLLQNNFLTQLYNDPAPYFIAPAWAIVAYFIALRKSVSKK